MFSWGRESSDIQTESLESSKTNVKWGTRSSLSSYENSITSNISLKSVLESSELEISNSVKATQGTTPKPAFDPVPYTFKMPMALGTGCGEHHRVECPPFHILLDHTIAVVWILYSKKSPSELGIVHLYWALSFLQAIRNQSGDTPDDIAMCIEAVQVRLAHMHSAIATFINPSSSKLKGNVSFKSARPPTTSSLPMVQSYESFKKSLEQIKTVYNKQAVSRSMVNTDNYPVSIALNNMLQSQPKTLIELFSPQNRPIDQDSTMATVAQQPDIPQQDIELKSMQNDGQLQVLANILPAWRTFIIANLHRELKNLTEIENIIISVDKILE